MLNPGIPTRICRLYRAVENLCESPSRLCCFSITSAGVPEPPPPLGISVLVVPAFPFPSPKQKFDCRDPCRAINCHPGYSVLFPADSPKAVMLE